MDWKLLIHEAAGKFLETADEVMLVGGHLHGKWGSNAVDVEWFDERGYFIVTKFLQGRRTGAWLPTPQEFEEALLLAMVAIANDGDDQPKSGDIEDLLDKDPVVEAIAATISDTDAGGDHQDDQPDSVIQAIADAIPEGGTPELSEEFRAVVAFVGAAIYGQPCDSTGRAYARLWSADRDSVLTLYDMGNYVTALVIKA